MLDPQTFAREWIEAWNAHDLDAILAHYAPDVEYQSPFVARLSGSPAGLLHGSVAVRAYISRALEAYPDLRFVLLGVYGGVNSVVLHYQSVNNLVAAEFFQFNERGKISRIAAHYNT